MDIKEKYRKLHYFIYVLSHFIVGFKYNKMNVCNYDLIWLITWTFLYIIVLQNEQNIFLINVLQCVHYIGYKLCTHQCECVGTKISSITEEQISRNWRIKMDFIFFYCLTRVRRTYMKNSCLCRISL